MRIAFLEPYPQSFYGAQRSLLRLSELLQEGGDEAVVVTPSEGVFSKASRLAGLPTHVLELGSKARTYGDDFDDLRLAGKLQACGEVIDFSVRLSRWVREEEIEVLYANTRRAVLYSFLVNIFSDVPVLWGVRAEFSMDHFSGFAFRICDAIIANAQGILDSVSEEISRKGFEARVVHTGFDFEEVRSQIGRDPESALPEGVTTGPTVACVGSVCQRKGQIELVEALPRVQREHPSVNLLLAGAAQQGHSAYVGNVRDRLDELALADSVHLLGHVEEIGSIYDQADLVVLPSTSEGLPRALIEALAFGTPVVATDVGGVREIVQDEVCGTVIEDRNPETIARAILDRLEAQDGRLDYQRRRIELVESTFGLEGYRENFLDAVEMLTGRE